MKTILRIALPAALALSASAVQAQTLETDYPVVGGTVALAASAVIAAPGATTAPFLLQSNYEGPQVHPAYTNKAATRFEALDYPMIAEPWGPGHNA